MHSGSIGDLQCDNGNCVIRSKKCDGVDDCGDGTDESKKVCGEDYCSKPNGNAGPGFECKKRESTVDDNGFKGYLVAREKCIPRAMACDGEYDCDDGSDETTKTCGKNCAKFPATKNENGWKQAIVCNGICIDGNEAYHNSKCDCKHWSKCDCKRWDIILHNLENASCYEGYYI